MDERARRFRKRARLENRGRSGRRRRYSRSLQAEAVAYLRKRLKSGASTEAVASELGVSGWSLIRWRRAEGSSSLRPVEVVPDDAETGTNSAVTLVTPEGYRVEGLDRRDIGPLLETLR